MKTRIWFIVLFLSTLSPIWGQVVNIGDILCTDGSIVSREAYASSGRTAEGIVFYVDKSGEHGWAVNLHTDAVDTDWVNEAFYDYEYDIPDLPNCATSRQALFDLDGYQNTAVIRAAHGPEWYPAAWAVDFDNGWYLPAAGQMRWLLSYVNEVNASLAMVGGSQFVLPNPDWHWTSTEMDGYHTNVVTRIGSTSNYMKWNYYQTYKIGVRSIKDFSCNSVSEYHVGDVVIAPGGQKGIVFYVSPEDGSYWLTALDDLSETYPWGNDEDLDELDNVSDAMSRWYEMQGIYCGYDATRHMREAQGTNPSFAASHVDFENGWHIPSIGQLSKLFAALPHIEGPLLENGGHSPSGDFYWSSTECTESKAWVVDFGQDPLIGGRFVATEKLTPCKVRPVWSLPYETPLPEPTLPDNIIESDCNDNTPQPFQGGQLMYQTPTEVNVYATPLCGDIDDDGIVDIVIPHFTATDDDFRIWSNQIDIYSGIDLSLQNTISIPELVYCNYLPIGIVRYPLENGEMQGAVVVLCNDGKLRSYAKTGQMLNVADADPPCDGNIAFADFNNDGFPEVYVGNAIYDVATLRLLCAGPADGNKGLSYRGSPGSPFPHRSNYALPFASNLLGDEKLELICGNTIYEVNISSRTNPNLNSITTINIVTPPSGYPQDGNVTLADLDLDGETEVVVTKDLTDDCTVDYTYFYAYKPSTGSILFEYKTMCRSTGFPAICNLDSDPHPEILFTDYLYDVPNEKMRCMRYTTATGLNEVWSVHHNDPSGMTTMTFFDFNLDEIPEIVYRDSYNLNIMDGPSGMTLYSSPMRSGTGSEHPIIADVNNDGHAEIITCGLTSSYDGNNGHGSLLVFGSEEWPAARNVWNQYSYNITNVNNDLTIPKTCFDNAHVFTAEDGTVRRPYNNFLQQAGYIILSGEPYNPVGAIEIDTIGTGCGSYHFLDTIYTESGLYDYLIETATGCDTLYHLDVSLGETVTHDIWRVQCYSFTWNGEEYTESGLYQQTFIAPGGCDSIVTLHLQIRDTLYHDFSMEACYTYTWNGITYTEPGDHIQTFEAEHGCDSIVTLHLSFADALEYDLDSTACGSFEWNGQEYTQSGIYDQQFIDSNGCDSIVHLSLTVKDYPAAVPPIAGPDQVFVTTDMVLGEYLYSITPVDFATSYEWEIVGAEWILSPDGTQCSLLVTTAGTATLKVKAWNDCGFSEQEIIIHAGFHDLDEFTTIPVAIYPNPANDKVRIEADDMLTVRVFDSQGQLLEQRQCNESSHLEIPINQYASGIYHIEIRTQNGIARKKFGVIR